MKYDLSNIARQFLIEGQLKEITSFGSGHINDTFKMVTSGRNYILQRINHNVFNDISGLSNNIARISEFLKEQLKADSPCMQFLYPIITSENKLYFSDNRGNHWRVFNFIENSFGYDYVRNPVIALEGGRAYGWFLSMLNEFPVSGLSHTIPKFHNLGYRYDNFFSELSNDRAGRVKYSLNEIRFIEKRIEEMSVIQQLGKDGVIPKRVTHNDTKISNVLFDKDNRAICIVDLDTVMPGYVHFDFGDAIRTFTNSAVEDEKNSGKISMDIDLFRAFSQGFIGETKPILNNVEIETLAFSAKLMTYIIGLRFLTDYLEGDVYYKTNYPDHNLIRARAQFKLLESMEKQYYAMQKIIEQIKKG